MKLLEYQAKVVFDKFHVPVKPFVVIDNLDEVEQKMAESGLSYPVVVKAQVQIGGRGKAGGVKFAENLEELKENCAKIMGMDIRGYTVHQLMIVGKVDYKAEWYLSIMLDRLTKCPLIMFSACGGMDIEETAKVSPEKILKVPVNPMIGINDYTARYLLSASGLDVKYTKQLYAVLTSLYNAFRGYDTMLVEVNPLVVDNEDNLVALDGKVEVDDSALYRLPDVAAWRDAMVEEDFVKEARSFNFLYIPIEKGGSLGVVSNGSGMMMSCIDMISKEGMKVAAGLDLGGGATAERIKEAMRIMFSTPGIKAVLINIFGGITRCDEVAGGVKLAFEHHDLGDKLVVIRMEGTNKEKGIEIIESIEGDVVLVPGLRESIKALVERRDQL